MLILEPGRREARTWGPIKGNNSSRTLTSSTLTGASRSTGSTDTLFNLLDRVCPGDHRPCRQVAVLFLHGAVEVNDPAENSPLSSRSSAAAVGGSYGITHKRTLCVLLYRFTGF